MKPPKGWVMLEVTVKKKYMFQKGEINGWTPEQVAEDWFLAHPLGTSHASRSFYHIGGGDSLVNVVIHDGDGEVHKTIGLSDIIKANPLAFLQFDDNSDTEKSKPIEPLVITYPSKGRKNKQQKENPLLDIEN